MTDDADKPVDQPTRAPGRSGRAIVSRIVEETTVSPSGGPYFDDCYTTLLHNPDDDPGSSSGKRSGKRTGGYSTARDDQEHQDMPSSPRRSC